MPVPNLESHLVMARLKGWATVIEWRCRTCNHEFVLDAPVTFFSSNQVTCPKCNKSGAAAIEIYSVQSGTVSRWTGHEWKEVLNEN